VKRSMDVRWAEVKVGLFLVVALALLGLAIFTVGRQTQLFAPKTKVQVLLSNVQGLKIGAPVWLSGVVVGAVSDISFTSPPTAGQVLITLEIGTASARRLGTDARITIKTRGLLGEKYVDITPGTVQGVPTHPIQGEPTISLDQVVAEAYSSFARLGQVADRMESGQGTMGKLMQDSALYDHLVQLTDALQTASIAMTKGKGTLAKLLSDPHLYNELMAFSRAGKAAASQVNKLAVSWRNPKGTLGKLTRDPALYDQSVAAVRHFQRSMGQLDALLTKVGKGKGTTAKLVGDPQLYDQMVKTLKDLDALVADMKKNPHRYVQFSLF
jgi:phospholipid/cholesterol/gamma-HCH transport system substrate-binding protein